MKLFFNDDGFIPNSQFPVILTRKMVKVPVMRQGAKKVEAALTERALKVGWNLEWLWPVFKRPHYHSTTHEALIVFSGSATLQLGGRRVGKCVEVSPGDAIVIPAGVAHQAAERSKDFMVFGFYPVEVGFEAWDMRWCRKKDRDIALPNLAKLDKPPTFKL